MLDELWRGAVICDGMTSPQPKKKPDTAKLGKALWTVRWLEMLSIVGFETILLIAANAFANVARRQML